MDVTLGIALASPVYAPTRAGLGRPIWNALALLQDLELRLGLPPVADLERERLQIWTARLRERTRETSFYARSFVADELATAALTLEWRDQLVEGGWTGEPLGTPRIDELARLEAIDDAPPVPLGTADRMARVEYELRRTPQRLYQRIRLIDPREMWPGRWQHIFQLLGEQGTPVERDRVESGFSHLPRNSPRSDLECLQRCLSSDGRDAGGHGQRIRGDGSLLLLRSDTPNDLAELTAAMLASRNETSVVVRARDPGPLDAALVHYGLATQGISNRSKWRPAMQVLALALELAFEPRDPYRVLELLTLPVGPFRGLLGAKLARAVARQPGIGGKEWVRQRGEAAARLRAQAANDPKAVAAVEQRLDRVRTWLERPGAEHNIRRGELQGVVERVQGWLHGRLAGAEMEIYAPAYAQTALLADALRRESRPEYSREDVRRLFDTFARSELDYPISPESTGRIAHVPHPSCILEPSDNVFVWNFVAGLERAVRRPPWSADERARLDQRGITILDPALALRTTNDAWRRAALSARVRLVVTVPSAIRGTANPIHPFWDEICARLPLDERAVAAVTCSAHDVLAGARRLVPTSPVAPLSLPSGRSTWTIPRELLVPREGHVTTSVTALERIITCPLAWVLEQRAGFNPGAVSKVSRGGLLSGNLAHRLVEVLHHERAFEHDEEAFLSAVDLHLEALVRAEGATLLLAGASVERLQLVRQLRSALRELHRYFVESGFRIAAVEEEISASSAIGPLHGRIDLRLVDRQGNTALLDLKWGGSSYRELLEKGRSVQLAVYAQALGRHPPAGYFAINRGQILSTDHRMSKSPLEGPSLEETWQKVEATARTVLDAHSRNEVHVPAARAELPLLDLLRVPQNERDRYCESPPAAACGYCSFDGICGRKWRSFS